MTRSTGERLTYPQPIWYWTPVESVTIVPLALGQDAIGVGSATGT